MRDHDQSIDDRVEEGRVIVRVEQREPIHHERMILRKRLKEK
jgi:hypothetical protein